MLRHFASLCGTCLFLIFAGCGDSNNPASNPDASVSPDACQAVCGNGVVECGEQCDDLNTANGDGCSSTCKLECGDGIKQAGEKSDTGIPPGMPGACPTSCDDGDPCTTDTLSGSGCDAVCVHGPIEACTNGDGCCPHGCTSGNDNDCAPICGNGVVDSGETCDTAIAPGA